MCGGLWPRHLGIEGGFSFFWPSKEICPPAIGGEILFKDFISNLDGYN